LNLGVDENGENGPQRNRWTQDISNAADDSSLGRQTDSDVGSRRASRSKQSGVVRGQSRLDGEQPQGRCGVCGPSAQSGRGRQPLDEAEVTEPQPWDVRSERMCRQRHEVFLHRTSIVSAGAKNLKSEIPARLKRKPIA
jgi:hypothetical protein